MTKDKPFEMPDRPEGYNVLTRIINFDTSICNGHALLLCHKEEADIVNQKHKLVVTPIDVWEDGAWFGSKTQKVKSTPNTIIVNKGFFIRIGKGSWSKDLDFGIILPNSPNLFPPFMNNMNTQAERIYRDILLGSQEKVSTDEAIKLGLERENQLKDNYLMNISSKPKIFEKDEVEVQQNESNKNNQQQQSEQYGRARIGQ